MRLSRISVRNIRSYESAALDFAAGTTLLVGDVGAGKTSLLYAIEMALFGVAEVDAAYLVRHGAPHAEVTVEFADDEHRYEVARRFRRVKRRGKEGFEPEKISFRQDGATTNYSATELRQRVIELLGFPDNPNPQAHSDLWRWAVYVPQERMRDILAAKPQDRLETVRKALGVERYRTAADNAQELATDLRRSAGQRHNEAERLRHFDEEHARAVAEEDRLRGELAAVTHELVGADAAAAAAQRELMAAETLLQRGEADLREQESLAREQAVDRRTLDERRRRLHERNAEAARRTEELAELRRVTSEVEPLENALRQSEEEQRRARDLSERHAVILRQLTEVRTEVAAAGRRVAESTERRDAAGRAREEGRRRRDAADSEGPGKEPPAPTPEPLAAIDRQLERLRATEAEALRGRTQAETARDELAELLRVGVCPRCDQRVSAADFQPHLVEAEASLAAATRELERVRAERTQAEGARASRERYERAHDRWRDSERRRATAREELGRLDEAAAAAERSLEEAGEQFRAARARLAALEPREAEGAMLTGLLEGAEADYARRRAELERARLASERIRAAERALADLRQETEQVARDIGELDERIAGRAGRLLELEPGVVALEEARREATRRRESLDRATAVRNDLAGRQARTETRVDQEVLRRAAAEEGRKERRTLLAEELELNTKAEWTSGPFRRAVLEMEQKLLEHAQVSFEREFARYFASLIDDPAIVARTDVAFTPAVTIEGEWTPADALSGGERTSLALAFRLALARVVRSLGDLRLDTILLDEPTDGFSPEQVIRMGELLDELALPQVIIVSHENQLAAVADRTIRVEKHDGRSVLSPDTVPGPGEESEGSTPIAAPPVRRNRSTARSAE